jgi:peroxiredoxin Q/BCP
MLNYKILSVLLLITAIGFGYTLAQQKSKEIRAKMPKVGEPAPDFKLPAEDGKTYTLKQLKGSWVVLAFYPGDFTPG